MIPVAALPEARGPLRIHGGVARDIRVAPLQLRPGGLGVRWAVRRGAHPDVHLQDHISVPVAAVVAVLDSAEGGEIEEQRVAQRGVRDRYQDLRVVRVQLQALDPLVVQLPCLVLPPARRSARRPSPFPSLA